MIRYAPVPAKHRVSAPAGVVTAFVLTLLLGLPANAAPIATSAAPSANGAHVEGLAFDHGGIAAHRAVYDLRLESSGIGTQIGALRGRMVYDYTGAACAGWSHTLRLVTRTVSPEAVETIHDSRSSGWEAPDSSVFEFASESYQNGQRVEAVAGVAQRHDDPANDEIFVERMEPGPATRQVPAETRFPGQHAHAILAAAKAGKRQVTLPFFDGSDAALKVFDTFVSIGRRRTALETAVGPVLQTPNNTDQLAQQPGTDQLAARHLTRTPHWPVSVGYFDPTATTPRAAAGLPDYQISYRLHDNGVLSAMRLDYGTLVLDATLAALTYEPASPCPEDEFDDDTASE